MQYGIRNMIYQAKSKHTHYQSGTNTNFITEYDLIMQQ
jgi:hypothetical protein